ncbi:MAG: 3-hydroxyacyl-CoA dehydrogenase NAD-binding domain-containing protein [Saprospiraceae bacterium]
MIKYKKDTENIVTLTLDMEQRHENVVNHQMYQYFKPVLIHLQKEKAKGTLKGIILTSGKKNFLEGGELEYLHTNIDPKEIYEHSLTLNKFFRALEHPGVPVVAAINGSALGTGFEFALACHHRIVVNDSKIRLGHPEVTVGLMPGNGGITRLLWLLGLEKAYTVLTSGKKYRPQEALKVGIIDAIAPNQKVMLEQAKQWLLSKNEGRRPWDRIDGKIPGGTGNDPKVAQIIQKLAAQLAKETYNNYPAPQAILNTLVEGSKVDFDTATTIESRYFTELALRPETRNMINTFWYDYNAIKKGINRPKGFGKFRAKQVGVIGAGRMGSGITFNCIKKGLKVVLKDVSKPIAELGKQYAKDNLVALVAQGTISAEEQTTLYNNITTSAKPEDFENCDLVIEAVYENEMVKAKALKDAEQHLDEYAIFATNTLSIPITKLAKAAYRPENYVGLHFFYPVEKVPLVEIVRGKKTSDETIARAFDFVRTMGKIPIVVKDDWGFYVARVQNTYILEGITLLQEGYPPALIENLGLQAGMPKGALAFADDLSLRMVLKYENQAAAHYGSQYVPHPAVSTLKKMVEDLDRTGQFKQAGFYEYTQEGKHLWKELSQHFPVTQTNYLNEDIKERMLFAQVIEAIWCMQEKVISSVPEANLGSIYGWGFPAFTGGIFQYVNSYGLDNFIKKCEQFKQDYGPRFRVPRILKKMRKEGKVFA